MIDMASRTKQRRTLGLALTISLAACSGPDAQSADLVLIDGSLYSYAWRTMLELGVPLTFNSDNPGSSHDPFYGLHSAVTRRDPSAEARGGWYPEQAVTPEEAIRAYTSGAPYAAIVGGVIVTAVAPAATARAARGTTGNPATVSDQYDRI